MTSMPIKFLLILGQVKSGSFTSLLLRVLALRNFSQGVLLLQRIERQRSHLIYELKIYDYIKEKQKEIMLYAQIKNIYIYEDKMQIGRKKSYIEIILDVDVGSAAGDTSHLQS